MANVKIESSWEETLKEEFEKPYFEELIQFVKAEYAAGPCYPPGRLIFNAFNHTPFDKVKVVILGQDPYHEPGQAHGLCFSVPQGIPAPPSLVNIMKEIQAEGFDQQAAFNNPGQWPYDLTRWADQGVFLLNTCLSVRAHQAFSHSGHGWETFTDAVIKTLAEKREGLVFLLWGAPAGKKASLIDGTRHLVLRSAHPSPLSAYRGFFNNHHFTLTNDYLIQHGQQPIQW
ncbi:MAG: uracil-DNA glycosylase [Bacteroidales bacterium]|nr:uracil-DNA glycosylase [Bacteroidales bacterium]